MRKFTSDDSGLSYSIVTIFIVLIYMSMVWMVIGTVVQDISASHEEFVAAGEISQQTQKFYNLSVNIFKSNILFGIIGLALWGIRQSKFDTASSVKDMNILLGSATIMLVLSFLSVILVFAIAHPLDITLFELVNSGILDNPDIYENNNFTIVDIFYIACITPGMVGIAIHLLTSVEKIGFGMFGESNQVQSDDYYVPESEV